MGDLLKIIRPKPQAEVVWTKNTVCASCDGSGVCITYGPKQIELTDGDKKIFGDYLQVIHQKKKAYHRQGVWTMLSSWIIVPGLLYLHLLFPLVFSLERPWQWGALAMLIVLGCYYISRQVDSQWELRSTISRDMAQLLSEYGVQVNELWTVDNGKTVGIIYKNGFLNYPLSGK